MCRLEDLDKCTHTPQHLPCVCMSERGCVADLGEGAVLTEPLGSWKGEGGTVPWMGRK